MIRALGLTVLGAAMLVAFSPVSSARAAEYQYWSYWTVQDGAWRFAPTGPVSKTPADGDVEGWRFAVTGIQGQVPPSMDPATAFASTCDSDAPIPDGTKRVAVVLDAGSAEDAPEGESPPPISTACVVIDAGANGYEVVSAQNELRTNEGFICAINDYPAQACGDQVADRPTKRPSETPTPTQTETAASNPTPSRKHSAKPLPTNEPVAEAAPTSSVTAATQPETKAPWLPAAIVGVLVIAVVGVVAWARRR